MKKLIVFSVILVLLTGMAFAEINVSGNVLGAWYVAEGTSEKEGGKQGDDGKKNQPGSHLGWTGGAGDIIRARVTVSGATDEGDMGGSIQIRGMGEPMAAIWSIWWQPADIFKMTLGYVWGGGNFSASYASAQGDILPMKDYGRSWGWTANRVVHPWGWEPDGGEAVSFELSPMDNLYFIVSVPYGISHHGWKSATEDSLANIYMNTAARVAYTIDGIGQAVLTYDGGTNKIHGGETMRRVGEVQGFLTAPGTPIKDPDSGKDITNATLTNLGSILADDPTYLMFHFNVTAVENLDLTAAFTYALPESTYKGYKDAGGAWVKPDDAKTAAKGLEIQRPMGADLRVGFTADAFNVNAGVGLTFGGQIKNDDFSYDLPLTLGVTVNPKYDLGFLTVGLVGEFKYVAEAETKSGHKFIDSHTAYNIIPYVTKAIGSGALWAGFQFEGNPVFDKVSTGVVTFKSETSWSIPIGFEFSF